MSIADIDIFKLNKAFVALSIVYIKQLGIKNMINPNGDTIFLGHPVGALEGEY